MMHGGITLDAEAHVLVGMALKRLADDHEDGDVALFAALLRAWLGWAGEMHCPDCTRRLLDLAQADLAEAARRLAVH